MNLDMALKILVDSHTRDNDFSGFTVESMRDNFSRWSDHDYIEAWKTVRTHLHMQVDPQA